MSFFAIYLQICTANGVVLRKKGAYRARKKVDFMCFYNILQTNTLRLSAPSDCVLLILHICNIYFLTVQLCRTIILMFALGVVDYAF
jgi:hypothetical protein